MTGSNVVPFNPLDKRHLGESVGQAMLRQPVTPLGNLETFNGAGIYAIYYTGDFSGYEPISKRNRNGLFTAPIYVGKAVPKGARKGGDLQASPGKVLCDRLKQHAKSIDEASNLNIADFHCRYLIVDDIWIPLGESLLIAKFDPLWNKLIDGFGTMIQGKDAMQACVPDGMFFTPVVRGLSGASHVTNQRSRSSERRVIIYAITRRPTTPP